jgi:hypothetical protein
MILYHKKLAPTFELGFETYCAPDSFDRTAQAVDIYEVFKAYFATNANAKWIYSVDNATSATTVTGGTSYRWAQTVGGVETITDIESGTITWTVGSTKRWVIVNHTTTAAMICTAGGTGTTNAGIIWLYLGHLVYTVTVTGVTNRSVKYIHIHAINNITAYSYEAHNQGSLTGVIHMSNVVTAPSQTCFQYCTLVTNIVIGTSITSLPQFFCYGCTGTTGQLTIPDSVITIGNQAFMLTRWTSLVLGNNVTTITCSFASCAYFTGLLTIPNSVVTITGSSFSGNTGWTSLSLGTGLVTIGANAFANCTSMGGTLTIPALVTSIGQSAFSYTVFNAIDVSANACYHSHDYVLYEESTHTAIHGIKGRSGTLTIENDTVIIGNYCFASNTSRTGAINIPNGVTTVGTFAFDHDSGFTSLTIPDSVITINSNTFAYLTNVASLTWNTTCGITAIPYTCFTGSFTAAVGTFVIPDKVVSIGGGAFANCKFTGLVIGSKVATIAAEAFWNVPLTGTLNIPASVITMSYDQTYFWGASNFSSITSSSTNYPASDNVLYDVKTAGQVKAWWAAKSYSGTLTFRSDTTHILHNFTNHTGRSGTLTIPNTVISIGIFKGCTGFTSVSIGTGLTSIPANFIDGCTSMAGTLTLPSSVTAFGNYAFRNNAWTRVDAYRSTAPTTGTGTFDNDAMALHVPTGGGTGYGVAPWTTLAIFATITADL